MSENRCKFGITSFVLHILAMAFMLSDHLWATIIPWNAEWMTCLGRLAFPIFAFMTVEGFFHTKNIKRYAGRLLLFALISEIPFNLMMCGRAFFPLHQNVLWSFLIGIMLIHINEKARAKENVLIRIAAAIITVVMGYVLGLVTMVDYLHGGVLTILVFYFSEKRSGRILFCRCCFYGTLTRKCLAGTVM